MAEKICPRPDYFLGGRLNQTGEVISMNLGNCNKVVTLFGFKTSFAENSFNQT